MPLKGGKPLDVEMSTCVRMYPYLLHVLGCLLSAVPVDTCTHLAITIDDEIKLHIFIGF